MPHRLAGYDDTYRRWTWVLLLAGASFVFSLALACATPFAALGAQQLVIYLATFRLPSDPAAFAPTVLLGIAWTNALAFVVLAALQILGAKLRLSAPLIGLERFQTG
ncbi:MAG: hypothetical protein AAGA21_23365 [Pseudomonadota bacterium]